MACVAIDDRGIDVINPFHRRHFDWSEIQGFRIGRYGTLSMVAEAILRNGSSIPLVGLRAALSGRRSRDRVEAAVGELERLRSLRAR